MAQKEKTAFPKISSANQMSSMLKVDLRRMFTTSPFYIILGIALVIPILVLVMTSGLGGAEGLMFSNAWQIIASESGAGMMAMDATAMMNINLMYFMTGIFVCLFVAEDFRSGYAKNLFTVRARKTNIICTSFILTITIGGLWVRIDKVSIRQISVCRSDHAAVDLFPQSTFSSTILKREMRNC